MYIGNGLLANVYFLSVFYPNLTMLIIDCKGIVMFEYAVVFGLTWLVFCSSVAVFLAVRYKRRAHK